MNIFSVRFLIFLIISLCLYYTAARRKQWVLILAANLVFYGFSGLGNLIFIAATTFSTWLGARLMESFEGKSKAERKAAESKEDKQRIKKLWLLRKRLVLAAVLVLNFGILGVLKYTGDILSLLGLGGPDGGLSASGGASALILPLGISFYTFQSTGYLIDIYGAKYEAEKSLPRYAAFVSFFPQLIQGPINRFDELKTTLFTTHRLSTGVVRHALSRFAFGALKKFAVADLLSGSVSAILDSTDTSLHGMTVAAGILMYGIQQYTDFSGGIDMVLAVAELFGIKMRENFRQPYFSISIGDFWRRWHISLGAWMRDYVFYPFALTKPMQRLGKHGKSEFGKHFFKVLPACIANILVFFLVGLWHGAQLHYILWGLYNGILIALSDVLSPVFTRFIGFLKINSQSAGMYIFRVIRTFALVHIGWYFDRIYDFEMMKVFLKNTVFNFDPAASIPELHALVSGKLTKWTVPIIVISYAITALVSIFKEKEMDVYKMLYNRGVVFRWVLYLMIFHLIQLALIYGTATESFMYAFF